MEKKQNLELKHYCPDFKPVRKVLKGLGAEKVGVKKQKDFFFHLPAYKEKRKARMKLRVEGGKMRLVYYERPDFIAGKDTSAAVILLETDEGALAFLKQTLGVSVIVEKRREIWRKDNTVFHLDEVKGVGKVFEVELQKHGVITERDKRIFANYQKNLLPVLGKVIQGSNANLVAKVKP
ncbi:MAG: class IV adenylate cyclase [bacterium]|nr:class IV adenylate cyclase [bacterium]